jgi:hypothetical protein
MQDATRSPADGPAAHTRWLALAWSILLLGLLAWQGWMTLALFGPDDPWSRLTNADPVLSGRHPLHLYHGYLGAVSLRERGTPCCYDPAFQAGYPKTPIFDGGSRPAEVLLALTGGRYRPEVYKLGLAASCLLVPLLLAVGAWGAGLRGAGTFLTTAVGLLVWWSTPGRQLLEEGDLDLLLAGLAGVAQAGLLIRFDRHAGPLSWLGLVGAGALGWFAHPLLFAGLLPLVLLYYLSVGARHGLHWHWALLFTLAAGPLLNSFWLVDYVRNWWICSPLNAADSILRHRTLRTVWSAPCWGDDFDRALAVAVLIPAVFGVVLWNQTRHRPAARVFGLGAAALLGLAIAGVSWEPCGQLGTSRLLVPALWCALPPATHAVVAGCRLLSRKLGRAWHAAVLVGALGALAVFAAKPWWAGLSARLTGTTPLAVGLGAEREQLVAALRSGTGDGARILWEDGAGTPGTRRWTTLLPVLTGRVFVGGLDPDVTIEHAYAGFLDGKLVGRTLTDWADSDLDDFCRRYNIGWVASWSPAARARWRAWDGAELLPSASGVAGVEVFRLKPRSFALKGQARLLHADSQRIALADVVPEDGQVVLSLHYQAGLRASPSRVQVEREPDPHDPIAFVRLRLPGPIARVTLTWED